MVSAMPAPTAAAPKVFTIPEIEARMRTAPRLPSLRSIQGALRELLAAEQRFAGQISDVIRRDPGLTARLLKLVNSAYFGLSQQVTSLEDAVFYVGVRQVRELATMTPVIEDFKRLATGKATSYRDLWKHCIATAIVTRELMLASQKPGNDLDYVAGLVHDVGWIVLATNFPDHHAAILRRINEEGDAVLQAEEAVLGVNHAVLGSLYLKAQELPSVLIDTVLHHHDPALAGQYTELTSAIQIADRFTRSLNIGHTADVEMEESGDWQQAPGWDILFGPGPSPQRTAALNQLKRSTDRLPVMVECLV
jgi:HD-like signal output (HDOD) protein